MPKTNERWKQYVDLKGKKHGLHRVCASQIGQWIGLLCARYWYRGVVRYADDDVVILDPATAIEVTGAVNCNRPSKEDPLPSPLVLSYGAIESISWPTWVNAPIIQEQEQP